MQVNNVSFGSTFSFNPKQLKKVSKVGRQRLAISLRRYANVSEAQLNDLFSGKSSTLKVADGNDSLIMGFFKVHKVNPKIKVSKKA